MNTFAAAGLNSSDLEPIDVADTIQPHGGMVAVDARKTVFGVAAPRRSPCSRPVWPKPLQRPRT